MIIGLLAGCSADVSAPQPSGRTASLCRALVAATPDTVDGEKRRSVDPRSPFTSAWGRPAITLACGVTKPAGLNAASKCWEVNGVGWYSEQRKDDIRWTTIGRRAYVQVTVPNKYAPQANPLVDLAAAVSRHNPIVQPCV